MFSPWILLTIILGYLLLLFSVAYFAERKEQQGKSIVSNPYIYSLSLAVYCTSWTFYGSVGRAANSGLSFLTIYIGPTLMAALWWIVLRKIVYLSKENRITTISDFISSRYGKSVGLSVLVTIVAVIGITPYLGLQLKAITTTFSLLSGRPEGSHVAGWFISLLLGVFAVIFGARKLDASERHGGLVFAVAFESAIKLVAFMSVGFFVTYGLFNGFGDIFGKIASTQYASLMKIGEGSPVSFLEWTSLTFLSMMAIMFLPRQFHVAVVENFSADHIKKAMWLFPLYLFLINIFVLPIAYGGLLLGDIPSKADYFVLSIPLHYGHPLLALIVFIGGFSAATAMIIVESVALSTMVMNSFVMPTFWNLRAFKNFSAVMLNIKRVVILGCVFLGYTFAVYIGEYYSLVDIGLKSFEAVTIFAPVDPARPLLEGRQQEGRYRRDHRGVQRLDLHAAHPCAHARRDHRTGRRHGGGLQFEAPEPHGALRSRRPRPLEPLPVLGPAPEPPVLCGRIDLHPAVRCRDAPGHHLRGLLLAAPVFADPPAREHRRDRGHPRPVHRPARGAGGRGRVF